MGVGSGTPSVDPPDSETSTSVFSCKGFVGVAVSSVPRLGALRVPSPTNTGALAGRVLSGRPFSPDLLSWGLQVEDACRLIGIPGVFTGMQVRPPGTRTPEGRLGVSPCRRSG